MNDQTPRRMESQSRSVQTADYPPAQPAQESAGKFPTAPSASESIASAMRHPLELDQQQIDAIVQTVPGGVENVQDIYPLSPLQEGMLFHRLLNEQSDTYVLSTLFELQSHAHSDALSNALQKVIDRHDVLRTAVLWEKLPKPLQVVYRRATLQIDQLVLDQDRDPIEQLAEQMRPQRQRMELQRAPLLRLEVTPRAYGGKWYALLRVHHVVCDYQSLKTVVAEAMACLEGHEQDLPAPVSYRSYVEETYAHARPEEAEKFFRSKLKQVDEPTAPFALVDVHGDGSRIEEARQLLESTLAQKVRADARRLGVSPARLFHSAWALVVAHTSGQDDVVFGTVVLAARQRSARSQRMLGMAVNTLPLRLQLRDVTAMQLVSQTDRELTELLNYEQSPLTLAQRCSGTAGTAPLFTALLNYRRSAANLEIEGGSAAAIRVLAWGEAWTNYPVTLIVDDLGEGFLLTAQTDRRIDPHRVMGYLHTAMQSLVEALEQAPQTLALSLSILPESERHQVIELFNATQAAYPQEKLIHELFEEQVERTPQEVAVVCADQYLTYRQLNCRANQLARYLREQGAGSDRFVGLCVERGIEMVVGVLGILKAGSAYVPLDPNYPQHRLEYILKDTAPIAVLTQERLKDRLPPERKVVALDAQWSEIAQQSATNLGREASGVNSANLAYVIYTSGSTGQPKGVAIEHRSAVNLIWWAQSAMPSDVFDETLHSTSLNFDLSVYECFVPLTTGGTLRVVQNALALVNERAAVTLINTVPSAIKGLLDSGSIPQTTRVVNLAGEALKKELVDRIFAHSAVECVCNLYGPSETTTYSTWVSMPREGGFIGTIGRPIANTQIYVLDRYRQIVPVGVVGEIYIGGAGVARGYLNRPELTAERFVADPFTADPRARMYKTGDLGRWRVDGTIEYLGRNDHQVKIRGFRIELGEIEAQLVRHEQVKEVVVLAREDVPGEKRLVAYVVPGDPCVAPSVEELRVHLKTVVPEYMVPSAFVMLERMPLTPNGKLDRGALPAPELGAYVSRQYEAPQGEVEEILAGIWQALLQVERVGRQDSFFELGGHSLLIVQMMERLRRVGLSAEIRRVFESQTLADLASALTTATVEQFEVPPNLIPSDCKAITPEMLPLVGLEAEHIERIVQSVPGGAANIQDIYPLVPLQEGILFHHLLDEQRGDTYVLSALFSVSSRERLNELIAALQAVIDRHDVLRTAVLWEELPRPVQVVYRRATLPVRGVALNPDRDPMEQIRDWLKPEQQRLDLRQAPLMRMQMAADSQGAQWYALLQLHHIAIDHLTLETVTSEVLAHLGGRAQQLPGAIPYRNHVAQSLAYARKHDAEAFFRSRLADVDEPTAPFGLLDVHGDGSQVEEAREEVESAWAQRVRAQARRLGVSAATLFHAAWGLVVAHTSGRDDVVFGSLLLGRLQGSAGAQRILGVFINTLPLRLRLERVTAKELVEQTQRELVGLLSHEQASLAVAQRCSGIVGSTPLFSTLLNYRHSVSSLEAQWSGAGDIRMLAFQERTNYPITLSVDDLGEGFALTALTDRRIDPHRVTGYLHTAVQSLAQALEQAPQTPALALSILPDDERRQVIELLNTTSAVYPQDKLIHGLFEEQVERTPNALAAMYEGQSLTYAELNGKANQLARHLRERGVGPDRLVGICVERSLEMVIGLLGILKAGGAYLPLDPNYPPERLEYMLQDAAPQVVLTQERLKAALPDTQAAVIALDTTLPELAGFDTENFSAELGLAAQNLVYVIYTSGSTGRPKGTTMPHRSMVNLIEWHRRDSRLGEARRVLQFAALSFDVAFQETFSTLCTGGTLVLLDEWVRKDARALMELLSNQSIERLFVPPLMLQSLAECCDTTSADLASLRDVITAGEQLRISPEIVNFFKRLNGCRLHNHYGPTETHVVTALTLAGDPDEWPALPTIGRPISNTQIYILDGRRQPLPLGAAGEIYIGGANVARGYLDRPELTAERFVGDPFSADPQARLYKTGDLGRWQADGTVEYLGRNDDQVKIRGFRIELGEIEAQLALHEHVKEVAVIAREDTPGQKRLVAYVTQRDERAPSAEELRTHLKDVLPEYMVPSAFVILESLPLTPSGKLNRRALPAPDLGAYASRQYEAPQGDVEEILAGIWQSLLRVERVGREDNFFELGGHSLLIVQMMERLRRVGFSAEVRRIFESPTLADLASVLTSEAVEQFEVPPNLIPSDCKAITPEMLPLVQLEAEHIERIVQSVPGGAANLQDIYPLAPLQEGILFHHLLNERGGDTYVVPILLSVSSRERLEELIAALQAVIDRHDILRTAVLWEYLPRPVQVVYRRATLPVKEIVLDRDREPTEQINEWIKPEQQRLDIRHASLMRLEVAADPHSAQWYALLQLHHIAIDHVTIEIVTSEVVAHLEGRAQRLPESAPYRNHVAQSLAYARTHDAEAFFRSKLGGINEPTAPFGLLDVYGNGAQIEEARKEFELALAQRVRAQARRLGVSAATLFHAAWGLVVAHTSGRDDVVFGDVLLGRFQGSAGAQLVLGLFINTLPLRLQLQGVTAKELVEQTQREFVELLSHEQASLAVAQRCSGIVGSAPLFTALLNYRHSVPNPEAEWSKAGGVRMLALQDRTNYPITLSVDDFGEGFMLTAQTDRRIDPRRLTGYVYAAVQSLVEALEQAPQTPALALSILPQSERRQVIELFNGTQAAYPQEKLIHELFEEQVERTPDAVAVVYEGQSLTYAELNAKANQLAWYLRGEGIGPDQLVALCVERNLDLVVGLLGIIKAGAAYLPLDPNYPPERLQYMLEDARPRMLLTQARLRERLPDTAVEVIALDDDWREVAETSTRNLDMRAWGLRSHHLAYVIYTSGSTGKPKGVMVEQRNVMRLFAATAHWFEFNERDVWTLFHSVAFDFSVWELWGALFYGGRVVVVPYLTARSPQDFYRLVCEQGVTVLNQTPSAFAQLIDAQARSAEVQHSLRVVIFGGEALELHTLQPWVERNGADKPQLVNMYGITETTVHVTYRPLNEEEIKSERGSLIGKPIPDLRIYLLGRHGQPVPIGVAGEMYVGGGGVARGYLNRPELTAERFVVDPFRADPQARLYKTGDLARWRTDGTLEYLGRNDDQVKIRGFRIELGEIEAQLVRHEQVKDAAVVAREDVPGEKRLVAYVVPDDPSGALMVEELRAHLKSVLPEYMVPSAFVMLERLPLTSNGKLDRRVLPVPELGAYASRLYQAPLGEVEEILAGIWQSLLRVERVGRQDNFFELGGHSLLIVQMMERLRRVGLSTEVRRVFESPTLADLASMLTSAAVEQFEVPPNLIPPDCRAITPEMLPLVALEAEHIERIVQSVPGGAANVQDIYPLAPLQEGILFHHLLNEEGGDIYVLPSVLCVSSRERLDELIAALQAVIDRHDVLRTAVLWENLPRPMQIVYRNATLPVREVGLNPDRDPTEQIEEWMKPERQRLDLRQAPLMRLQVAADTNSAQWYVLWQLHHILDDATSLRIVISEVVAHLGDRAQQLPGAVPYRNHVAQSLAYARKHDAETFFRSKLEDIDEPTAPFGLLDVHGDGTQIEEAREGLESDVAHRARVQARRLGVSAATLFHAAWGLVVAHTSGRDDIVFGSVLLGRLQGSAGAQRTLGMFINTLPLRLRLLGVTAKELVEQTQRELVELLSHEQASLAAAQRCSGVTGSTPLFTALFNYRHSVPNAETEWSSASGIRTVAGRERTNYPITLSVDDLGDGFVLTALTDRHIDPRRVTGYLRTAVRSLVQALEQAPQTPALALSILPDDERRQVVELLNATSAVYPRDKLIHELFEEQVKRTPDAVAAMHGQQSLTYAELNGKANQLARHLRSKGVGADQLVGICVERSLEMVVGLLGILKAGGAYLPLDPNYPPERLEYMLQDAAPQVVLTQEGLKAALPETRAAVIALDTTLQELAGFDSENLSRIDLGQSAQNLVYAIYTSGSTGRPKGTTMPHGSMVNLIEWHRRDARLGEARRVLQFAALSFDVAFQETFSTLCTGGTLVLLDEWVRKDARALAELLRDQSIERLFVPPLMLQALAECYDTTSADLARLRDVITAGEQLRISPEIVNFFRHLNGCRLHNHYGPTETHVVTALTLAGDPGEWPALPTIGQPIANTQIYVLDGRRQPLPLGVAGEIYIGGANVARGYLNRPELTAERFVGDPFSADPQTRLYKTGDLGRWQADGTIEYLGRNDDQVKIRGFRIELGEIEAQLALHEHVKEAAVIAREDTPGQKRLVAYVTQRDESAPSAEELRAHLKDVLPEYMVPSAFVVLESLPLTPSGKLNRRALPAPDLEAYASRQYEAPQGDVEEILAGIWQSLLRVERVGRQDNFFEIGGHSLLVLNVLFKINRSLGSALRVTDVYKNPTIKELAARICGGTTEDAFVDLSQEAALDEIVANPGLRCIPAKAVMLTGATGFVGRFLLAQLLQDTDATIYCLVRAQSEHQASTRLRTTLAKWDLWRDEFEQRVVAIPGDLRLPRLGIDEPTYRMLSQRIDSIYHCATSMNHLETYTMAKPANVEAARELLKLATDQKPKLINYISTLGIFSSSTTDATRVVDEHTPIDYERHRHSQGYAASKWVGEKIFTTASERGIPCNIFRLGFVWADSKQGRYDELQRDYRILKSCLLSGNGIDNYRYDMAPTPVDYTARAVVFLANRHCDGRGIFHISSSDQMSNGMFERCNEILDASLALMPFYEWICEIKRLHYEGQSLPVVPLIEFAFSMDEESFHKYQRNVRSASVRFDCTRTRAELEDAGIVAPALNDDLLRACVESMRSRDAELRDLINAENDPVADEYRGRRRGGSRVDWRVST